MDLGDLIGRLLPLLERKLDFMQSMQSRQMSLEEKKEANKTDLEYKKLEASITGEKDKLKWEKEKLTTTIKGNYDLEMAKQQGLVNLKNIDKMSAKEVAEIQTASQERINKYGNDAKNLPELLKIGVGQKVKTTDPVTGAVTESLTGGSPEATLMGTELGRRKNLLPAAPEPPRSPNYEAQADVAMEFLKNAENAKNVALYQTILKGQPAEVQAIIQGRINATKGQTAVPGTNTPIVAPPVTMTPAPTPVPTVTAPTMSNQPVRENVSLAPTPPTAAAAPTVQREFSPTLPEGSPAKAVGDFLGKVWERGGQQADALRAQKAKEDEEIAKARALRSARGVTWGNTF